MSFIVSVFAAFLFMAGSAQAASPIQLWGQPLGGGRVTLHWSNAQTANVDVYRDGVEILETPNIPPYPGLTISGQPTGSHVYRVCEPPTALGGGRCSNPATTNVT